MPQGRKTVSDSEIVAVMKNSGDPAFTASEIAEEVGMTKDGVYNRLEKLHDNGVIRRKQPQPTTVIWWVEGEEHAPLAGD